ncbi:hypothetical protein [Acinetobacter modestus]|uniref:Uncharacterized protein n=1 Tax=Acinetobacter modestus TaxID=1776740 RepID=A0ABP2TWF0_9GAMM|nr:hypothetical protein [Acinetobacter modestus]ENU26607.1 hypothetical protein F992_02155 [Acinetobacter modestus]GGA10045.1 hypothetical protein GCM10017554_02330 [Acinetobacter modestus]
MPVLVGFIYAFFNVLGMVAYAVMTLNHTWLPITFPEIFFAYVPLALFAIYFPLYKLTINFRLAAFFGLIPPWLLLLVIVLPQAESFDFLTSLLSAFLFIFFIGFLIEAKLGTIPK